MKSFIYFIVIKSREMKWTGYKRIDKKYTQIVVWLFQKKKSQPENGV
jgi:hypothetical protein